MTGGDCEIQDIQPFFGEGPDSFQQLDFETLTRNPKTVSTSEKRSRYEGVGRMAQWIMFLLFTKRPRV